jgi:hypothetical protein
MLPGTGDVTVRVASTSATSVKVDGREVEQGGDGRFTATVSAAQGMGFVAAQSGTRKAVRAWHQGEIVSAGTWQAGALRVFLGEEATGTGTPSLASLVSAMLSGVELAPYLVSPVSGREALGVDVAVEVTSARAIQVDVTMVPAGDTLAFTAHAHPVEAAYRTCSAGYNSSGHVRLEEVTVRGSLVLSGLGGQLTGVTVDHAPPVISDGGGLPPSALAEVARLVGPVVVSSVQEATRRVAERVLTQLLTRMLPEVGVAFDQPIRQQSMLTWVEVAGGRVALHYQTQVAAVTPRVARPGQGLLGSRTVSVPAATGGLVASAGSPLVNQLAYAAWDAGNFQDLRLTRKELEDAGMATLRPPYTGVTEATLNLGLPPLLRWSPDGPYLDMGEVRVDVAATGVGPTQAWTAASVPVDLAVVEGTLRVVPDMSRQVTVRDVAFTTLNTLAHVSEVEALMRAAGPAAVTRVFTRVPAVSLPRFPLERLDGTPVVVVIPAVTGVERMADGWALQLSWTMEDAEATGQGADGGVPGPDAGACVPPRVVSLDIETPALGAMLPGGVPVEVRVRTDAAQVTIAGTSRPVTPGEPVTQDLGAVDGLGVVVAKAEGRTAVRAWHQGTFLDPAAMHPATLDVALGPAATGTTAGSLAALLKDLLGAVDLAWLVDGPLALTGVLPVPVDVAVTSARASATEVTVTPAAGGLDVAITLRGVLAGYVTLSPCVEASGQVRYESVLVRGRLALAATPITFDDVVVEMSAPVVSGTGSIPAVVLEQAVARMEEPIREAVRASASLAGVAMAEALLARVRPTVGVAFSRPITQESSLQGVTTSPGTLSLSYGTRVTAVTPRVATAGQGVLQRPVRSPVPDGQGLVARVGSPLVNQIAFAAWDAGNLEGMLYTRTQLEGLGMPRLAFPYSLLESVQVRTRLPPLLSWDNQGPWLELGDVEMDITAAEVGDTRAWTTVRVPVSLRLAEGRLWLVVDALRPTILGEVAFPSLNPLADQEEVLRLVSAVTPQVVMDVFGSLPTLTVEGFGLVLADGREGPRVTPAVRGVTTLGDAWLVAMELTWTAPPAPQAPPAPTPVTGTCPSAFANTVTISTPPRGAMLPAGGPVTVTLATNASQVVVGDLTLPMGGQESAQVTVPAADGMGHVAVHAGDRVAARAWHQGSYRAPDSFHPRTVDLFLGPSGLSGGDASLAGLVSSLLSGGELAPYVENPIRSTYTFLTISTTITSATSPTVAVTLAVDGPALRMTAVLSNLVARYTSTSTGISSSGTVTYATVTVTGTLDVQPGGATLRDGQATTSPAVIQDGGGLPPAAVSLVLAGMEPKIKAAMVTAAGQAASSVATRLLRELAPVLGVSFSRPVAQETRPHATAVSGGLNLAYETRITAVTPVTAAPSHGVLERVVSTTHGAVVHVGVLAGAPVVNQLAFASWDAGNFSGLTLTRQELETAGMPPLSFPYDLLETATVSLLLPPLLAWTAEGAWLDVGDVEVVMRVTGVEDTRAWTAARIPVALVRSGNALVLALDDSRTPQLHAVELEELNPFADPGDVLHLVETAVPAFVGQVFGAIPTFTMPDFTLAKLDGTPGGPHVVAALDRITTTDDAWRMALHLVVLR